MLLKEKLLLEENWQKIKERVIIPLWHGKFKSMYERAKLDYDDFESLAEIELCGAIKSFNPDKSNILTYATRVITQKAMTELRNCTRRDKRKALHVAESIEALENAENIFCNTIDEYLFGFGAPKDVLSEKMDKYLGKLSKLQKQVLFAMSEGYSNEEIKRILRLTSKELSDACTALRSYRNTSLLY